jgi:hypothetical protein
MFILYDVNSPARRNFPYKAGSEKKGMVCLHSDCCSGAVHRISDLQPATITEHHIWVGYSESEVLHFHGKFHYSLKRVVADTVEFDTWSDNSA